MTRYKIAGYEGPTLDVETNSELVELMRAEMPFVPADNNATFMREVAKQVKMDNGSIVRTDDIDVFVDDLLTTGFLKQVADDKKDEG